MKKQLLTIFGVAALGMASYAATFMQVKTNDGKIVKFDVEDVTEVDFMTEEIIPQDTTPVIPSDTSSSIHSYVDLGLPSGTLWATYNVGATKPEEYGDYFAWGETEPKEVFNWGTYKYGVGSGFDLDSITKYNMSGRYGIIDSLSVLLPEDDAATANWGKEWRMPTNEEQRELYENSYMVWTDGYNGTDVSGVIFYKAKEDSDKGQYMAPWMGEPSADYRESSDAHVFFPAAGKRNGSYADLVGDIGYYLSSSLGEVGEEFASDLDFGQGGVLCNDRSRDYGFPVRAVRVQKAERKMYVVKFYTSDSVLINSQEVLEGASAKEIQAPEKNGYEFIGWSASLDNITSDMSVYALYKEKSPIDTPSSNHPYVDLGLPSGTLWATYNIGATKPEEYGDYFAWGETEPKEVYDESTYKWGDGEMTKYNYGDGLMTLLPEDDAATANWGSEWRMPTIEEQRELYENSYMEWTDGYNGTDVRGVIFYKAKEDSDKGLYMDRIGETSPSAHYRVSSDAHVFFPAAGGRDGSVAYAVYLDGLYWSSSLYEGSEYSARRSGFDEDYVYRSGNGDRESGVSVRAVRAK